MKFLRSFGKLLLSMIIMVSLASCSSATNESEATSNNFKIVSLSPSNTEILTGLGLSDSLVGVDMYSHDVDGLNEKTQVFKTYTPSLEEVLLLEPTHIVLSDFGDGNKEYEEAKNMGIEIISIPTANSLKEIYDSINLIGDKFSKSSEADKMISDLKKEVDSIKESVSGEAPTVYFEISGAPYLYSFGDNTYLNEMITLAGGKNIFINEDSWISPSEEGVIELNPDIIFTNVDSENSIEELKNRSGWGEVNAIKNGHVYYIDKNNSSRPSQYFIKALRDMNKYIKEATGKELDNAA